MGTEPSFLAQHPPLHRAALELGDVHSNRNWSSTGIHRNDITVRVIRAVEISWRKNHVAPAIGQPYGSRNSDNTTAAGDRCCLSWSKYLRNCGCFHAYKLLSVKRENETQFGINHWAHGSNWYGLYWRLPSHLIVFWPQRRYHMVHHEAVGVRRIRTFRRHHDRRESTCVL